MTLTLRLICSFFFKSKQRFWTKFCAFHCNSNQLRSVSSTSTLTDYLTTFTCHRLRFNYTDLITKYVKYTVCAVALKIVPLPSVKNYACAPQVNRLLSDACVDTNGQRQQRERQHSSVASVGSYPRSYLYSIFLKLATLSFAIPPPISVPVRSRQAGTETEREASAMEALGPGKF